MTLLFDIHEPSTRCAMVPRPYQHEDLDNTFKLWEDGVVGVLTRSATGTGKTIMSCMKMDRWLDSGGKCLVLSYEKQLVWQFAQEIEEVLQFKPGIEMEKETCEPGSIPDIVVATRQTLARHALATMEQQDMLVQEYGISISGRIITRALAKRLIRAMREGSPVDLVQEQIDDFQAEWFVNKELGSVSRLYKFNPDDKWMLVWDEAHKHAYKLEQVGHIVDWFSANPDFRQTGVTATPKRSDNVSLGDKMFPGISIDYPLFSTTRPSAVTDGYAVKYVQKYIQVNGVDFKEVKQLAGTSLSRWDAEVAKRLESKRAELCEPMLDLSGDRRTLIFSPTVDMARDVARYINARRKCECSCGNRAWHPKQLIGDGAKCRECGEWITDDCIVSGEELQCHAVWGAIPADNRREIYEGHQDGKFQYLSVCGLCREGYNDPGISCVAVFRPVTKEASSLAEQMKGRGSRPERGVINGLETAEERLAAIAASGKPDCLIIDLVGVTGLGDNAATTDIYADGVDDAVRARAQEIAVEGGCEDMTQAIVQAEEDVKEAREREKREREERERKARELAEQRAKAGATVDYDVHDRGSRTRLPGEASDKQLKYLRFLGMEFTGWVPSVKQAGRMIDFLQADEDPADAAYKTGVKSDWWQPSRASEKQLKFLRWKNIPHEAEITPREASRLIDRWKNPGNYPQDEMAVRAAKQAIDACPLDHAELTQVAKRIARSGLSDRDMQICIEYGRKKREEINNKF